MPFTLPSLDPAQSARFDTIIDVRSPAEFAEDHLPGALNLPVMSNEERARVGTIYVQDSSFRARKIGAALVARNAAHHLETALADKPGGWAPLIYCWRGGQRSNSFATILQQIGWRAEVLEGGYRSYRRLVVGALYESALPYRFVLLDGNTGSGKTAVLQALAQNGVQVLDLEALAEHRGSVLGAMGPRQPSQKLFESRVAQALSGFDPARPVVAEAESSRVGDCGLPTSLWKAMQAAPRIEIEAGIEARARFLTHDYAESLRDLPQMATRLDQLRALCGHAQVDLWQALLRERSFETLAAALITHHYDPGYRRARRARAHEVLARLDGGALMPGDIARMAGQVAALLDQI